MMKSFGFLVLGCCFFSGCVSTEYNLATKNEEYYLYSTDREIALGQSASESMEKQVDLVDNVVMTEKVQRILSDIVAVCDRKELVYFIKVIDLKPKERKEYGDDKIINAMSLPGGYIYMFKDLIEAAENDDEIAGVIAHEVGHVTARHGIKRLQASYGALILQLASTQANGNIAGGVGFALNSLFMEYSQQDEFESDRLAVKYLKLAGYNPEGMTSFLKKLKKEQDKSRTREFSYWRTHPHISQRIAVVNQEITGQLNFRDYMSLTEEKKW